jgi:hypothetical protein
MVVEEEEGSFTGEWGDGSVYMYTLLAERKGWWMGRWSAG